MTKVFIPQQQAGFDYSSAEDYGDIVSVFPPGVQIYGDATQFVDIARNVLKNCNEDDYLAPMGDPIMMMICAKIMVDNNDGTINILKWDKRKGQGGYRSVHIDFGGNH